MNAAEEASKDRATASFFPELANWCRLVTGARQLWWGRTGRRILLPDAL